jgi:hypothetical protein
MLGINNTAAQNNNLKTKILTINMAETSNLSSKEPVTFLL